MLYKFSIQQDFISKIIERVQYVSREAISLNQTFHIVLTGGETARLIYPNLKNLNTDWSKWQFWFGDERCYPEGNSNLNSVMAEETFLNFVPVAKTQIHKIPAHLGAIKAAENYNKQLEDTPIFDLTILGIGEDGHVASLFPGQDLALTGNSPDVIPVLHSPKPPLERISLSMNRINRSKEIIFIAKGKKKKEVINRVIEKKRIYPASSVEAMENTDFYILDI